MATAQTQTHEAWFRLAGAALDEADRRVEDGLRMIGKFHEQAAVSRRNLLELAEQSVAGARAGLAAGAAAEWFAELVRDPLVLDAAGRALRQWLLAKKVWDQVMAKEPA